MFVSLLLLVPAIALVPSASRSRGAATLRDSVDVSEYGLTLEDLQTPIPQEALDLLATGYDSTTRTESSLGSQGVAAWTETADEIEAVMTISGLRGQPIAALTVEATETSLYITGWGRLLWGCALKGVIDLPTLSFDIIDGPGMIPEISVKAKKLGPARWGGFIDSIGEESLI
ncbi:hypothetical protein M885DRAFT_514999 [Pelagophyceae sp. CCMP2097]|nr:hypothetical protein M885DRAFT_514999 [Pelagophyceae sp. CCMP2097]|mmetsp:Transcript_122/g.491  ORF Transcript_122/g.491 Transcript_122/m.491 type:complete len:173 (+) Transcript_122:83-601(+)